MEPCQIGLYTVTLSNGSTHRDFPVLCGVTDSGRVLVEDECKTLLALPVKDFTEDGPRSPHWLKRSGQPHELDKLVLVGALLDREAANLSLAQAEEMERMKLRAGGQKAALAQKLDGLEAQVKALEVERDGVTGDRLKRLALEKQATQLRLAANLLRDDGVIFISIDDNEVDNLKKICNEIFGEENFLVQIVWQKAFSPQNDAKFFSSEHEYVFAYAKKLDDFVLEGLPRGEKQNARFKNPDNDPRGPWASSDLLRMEHRDNGVFSITTPNGKIFTPEPGTSWRYPEAEILEMLKNDEIWFGEDENSKPRRKRFLKDVKQDITPQTIWKFSEVGHSQSASQALKDLFEGYKPFDFSKPVGLVLRSIQLTTENDKDDIILDFFSGSATTAHTVMQLNAEDGGNRRYIMVQLPEVCDEKSEAAKAGYSNICEIGKERIRRAGAGIIAEAEEANR